MAKYRYHPAYKQELRHHYMAGTPTLAFLLLIFGILWLLNSLGIFSANIPWIPTIIVVFAIGWLISTYAWRRSFREYK